MGGAADDARHGVARFEHHAALPVLRLGDAVVTVVVGEFAGALSPARVHTPLFGAEIVLRQAGYRTLPLEPAFESAVVVMSGRAEVAGVDLAPGALLHLGQGRSDVEVANAEDARLFVLGGEPFDEPLVMWWNFVGRSHEEVVQARTDWMAERRFGTVPGCAGDPLPAPEMPSVRLKARDRFGRTSA